MKAQPGTHNIISSREKTMNAVIYARYSSDNQREESIEGQLRECLSYAEKNNLKIVNHYIDRAFSARTDDRPAFRQMIQESEKKEFSIMKNIPDAKCVRDYFHALSTAFPSAPQSGRTASGPGRQAPGTPPRFPGPPSEPYTPRYSSGFGGSSPAAAAE